MRISLRSSALVLAASMAVTVAPGVAFAATVTTLSAAQLAAELKAAAMPTKAASAGGWRTRTTMTGPLTMTGLTVVDTANGIQYDQSQIDKLSVTSYMVDHRGTYLSLTDKTWKAAVNMMGRPDVRYQFLPDSKLRLADYLKFGAPDSVLSEAPGHAGTKTVQDDGSVAYRVKDAEGTTVLHVGSDGVLTGVDATSTDLTMTLRYGYGPQHLEAPTAKESITQKELMRGVAYLEIARTVRDAAREAAATARRQAHGHTVKVTTLRKAARHTAAEFNGIFGPHIINVGNIRRGAKMTATNPWTHKTVTYAVTAHGKKATVHRL